MSAINRHSATWAAVRALCDTEGLQSMQALQQRGLDPIATEFHRGRIDALKAVMALAAVEEAAPVATPEPDTYAT